MVTKMHKSSNLSSNSSDYQNKTGVLNDFRRFLDSSTIRSKLEGDKTFLNSEFSQ